MKVIIFLLFIFSGALSDRFGRFNTSQYKLNITREHQKHINREIYQLDKHNKECQNIHWSCNHACRWPYNKPSPVCQINSGKERCFGQSITYNYTNDRDLAFPDYLKVIEHFPGCWKLLSRLVCGMHYRPCLVRNFYEYGANPDNKQIRTLWQLFPYNFCERAKKECGFMVDNGIWPDFLTCSKLTSSLFTNETMDTVVTSRRVILDGTNSCKMQYREVEIPESSKGCVSPLVEVTDKVKGAVIDRCHMPCNSAFVEDADKSVLFQRILLGFALILMLFFVAGTIYLFWLKKHQDGFLKFVLKMMFTSIGLLCFLWVFSLSTYQSSGSCEFSPENNGYLRRVINDFEFDWCTFQWLLFNTLLLSSYEWLIVLIYLVPAKANFTLLDSLELYFSKNNGYLGISAAFIVYLVAVSFSTLGLATKSNLPDGITSLCYAPIEPITSGIIIYFALILMALIACYLLTPLRKLILSSKRNGETKFDNLEEQKEQFLSSPTKKTDKLAILYYVLIVLGFISTVILMITMHYFFGFDSAAEKSAIDKKIGCVIEYIRKLAKSNKPIDFTLPDYCSIPQIGHINFLHLFLYAFLLPTLPFLFILMLIMIDLINENYGLWSIYEAFQLIQFDKDNEKDKQIDSLRDCHTEVTGSIASRPLTVPLTNERNEIRSSSGKKSLATQCGRKKRIDLESRHANYSKNYVPPYLMKLITNMIGEVTPNQIFAKLPPNEQAALLERQANIMNEMKQKIKETEEFIKYHAESTAGCSSSEQTVVQNDKSEEDEPVYEEENAQSDSDSSSSLRTTPSSLFEEHEDDDYPQNSLVLHEVAKYAMRNDVGNKTIFCQCAFEQFRNLFEKDDLFRKACILQRQKDPNLPGTRTLDENHLVTVPEVVEMTVKLQTSRSNNYQMCLIAAKAVVRAKEILNITTASIY